MSYQKIKVSHDGAVTVIALSDAATLNAAGMDLAVELLDAFKRVVEAAHLLDRHIRVVHARG